MFLLNLIVGIAMAAAMVAFIADAISFVKEVLTEK